MEQQWRDAERRWTKNTVEGCLQRRCSGAKDYSHGTYGQDTLVSEHSNRVGLICAHFCAAHIIFASYGQSLTTCSASLRLAEMDRSESMQHLRSLEEAHQSLLEDFTKSQRTISENSTRVKCATLDQIDECQRQILTRLTASEDVIKGLGIKIDGSLESHAESQAKTDDQGGTLRSIRQPSTS